MPGRRDMPGQQIYVPGAALSGPGCRDNRRPHSGAVRRPWPITADQQLLDDRCPCPAI